MAHGFARDFSWIFLVKSNCNTRRTTYYLAIGLNQEQSDLTSAVNATYIRKHQRYYLYKYVSTYS